MFTKMLHGGGLASQSNLLSRWDCTGNLIIPKKLKDAKCKVSEGESGGHCLYVLRLKSILYFTDSDFRLESGSPRSVKAVLAPLIRMTATSESHQSKTLAPHLI